MRLTYEPLLQKVGRAAAGRARARPGALAEGAGRGRAAGRAAKEGAAGRPLPPVTPTPRVRGPRTLQPRPRTPDANAGPVPSPPPSPSCLPPQYGVDVALNGHVHAYERSKPQYNYRLDPCGTIHITAGCGGKPGIATTGEYALDRGFIDDKPQPEYCADPAILNKKVNPTQPGPR